jgi:predicted Fe-S protein YdhL (DUF1289 family)
MAGRRPFDSPCIDVCAIDDATGWCIGCGRTMHEIATWTSLGDAARRLVLDDLPARKAGIVDRERRAARAKPRGE